MIVRPSGSGTSGTATVHDSWDLQDYLEQIYKLSPSIDVVSVWFDVRK